jgi:hypothetical protein
VGSGFALNQAPRAFSQPNFLVTDVWSDPRDLASKSYLSFNLNGKCDRLKLGGTSFFKVQILTPFCGAGTWFMRTRGIGAGPQWTEAQIKMHLFSWKNSPGSPMTF